MSEKEKIIRPDLTQGEAVLILEALNEAVIKPNGANTDARPAVMTAWKLVNNFEALLEVEVPEPVKGSKASKQAKLRELKAK